MTKMRIYEYHLKVPSIDIAKLVFADAFGLKVITDSRINSPDNENMDHMVFELDKDTRLICMTHKNDKASIGIADSINLNADKVTLAKAYEFLKDKTIKNKEEVGIRSIYYKDLDDESGKKSLHIFTTPFTSIFVVEK